MKINFEKIQIQNSYRANVSESALLVLDMQSDFAPTKPLLHKQSRFLYVTSGYAKIKIQNKVHEMKKGILLSLNPWQISEIIEVNEHVSYYLLIYKYELFNYQIKNLYNVNNEEFSFRTAIYNHSSVEVPANLQEKILHIFEDIREEIGICSIDIFHESKPNADIFIFSKVCELFVYFLRLANQEKHNELDAYNKFFTEDIFRYIFLNLSEDLTLSKLSSIFFMSESSISKYIKTTTGLDFYELVNSMKVKKIEFLLLHTNLTLNEIAEILNFSDAAQLSKTFSDHMEMTTSEYKKINLEHLKDVYAHYDSKRTKILEYIFNHYQDDISILDISEMFEITPKNINKILKYYVEQNFTNFLASVRVNKACKLLIDTDHPIIDIAALVGYNSEKTFNRHFKNVTGMNPSDFKNLNKINE